MGMQLEIRCLLVVPFEHAILNLINTMTLLLRLPLYPKPPNPKRLGSNPPVSPKLVLCCSSRRTAVTSVTSLALALSLGTSPALPDSSPPQKPAILRISNTSSWFQFYGDGFSIRVPPQFQDLMEPEDYNAGLSLYGDKVKPKTFGARFASADGSEVVSVVTRLSNQLKITFLEAKDIADLGSLKTAARIFVPGGANLYSARTIKVKGDEGLRTYYFYEFGVDEQHVALVASVNSGKVYIAAATAPDVKWGEDGVKLRSAVISLSVL